MKGMMPRIDIPFVADVPMLGAIFSGYDPLTWFAWLMVPATVWFLRRTRLGLRLRTTGAAPQAVRALGLYPMALRDASTVFAGLMAGIAGAFLSIGVVGIFNEGITAGRSFIALAAFYFGRNHPWPTALGAPIFGFFDAFQIRMQGRGVPAELVQTLPYIMVIVVLTLMALATKRARAKGA